MGFPCFIIRYDSEYEEFFCVLSVGNVVYGETYEQCEGKVYSYVDQNEIEMFILKRIDN